MKLHLRFPGEPDWVDAAPTAVPQVGSYVIVAGHRRCVVVDVEHHYLNPDRWYAGTVREHAVIVTLSLASEGSQ